MGKVLFRILFRLARKFGIEKLKTFLSEYAKGRFDYLLSPPEIPDISDFPEISLSLNDNNDENGNSASKVIKDVTVSIGGGVLLLTQLKTSGGEVREANGDLDSATEDWNDNLLPVFTAIGSGISSALDEIKVSDVKPPKLDLTQIPEYVPMFGDRKTEIKRDFGGGKEKGKTGQAGAITGTDSFVKAERNVFSFSTPQVVRADKFSVITRTGGTVIRRNGQEWRVKQVRMGESFEPLLEGYSYDSGQQTIGATDAFFGKDSGRMRKINKIILHCTADPEGIDHTLEYYNSQHLLRDGGTWMGVGYHFIIHPDGTIESARPVNMIGSHCKGQNANSIGIAYIGGMNREYTTAKDTRTRAQKRQMWRLVLFLLQRFPSATVHGHHEYDPKPCPCFDVRDEFNRLMRNGFDIDALNGGYVSSTEIRESSSQFADNLKTQKGDVFPIRGNGM